jgi:hypothetical protein
VPQRAHAGEQRQRAEQPRHDPPAERRIAEEHHAGRDQLLAQQGVFAVQIFAVPALHERQQRTCGGQIMHLVEERLRRDRQPPARQQRVNPGQQQTPRQRITRVNRRSAIERGGGVRLGHGRGD